MTFDPNATGTKNSGIFALPYTYEQAKMILVPVPWEVTTSYGGGTSLGPEAIYESSKQIDLCHLDTGDVYQQGIYWHNEKYKNWLALNNKIKPLTKAIQDDLEAGKKLSKSQQELQKNINQQCEELHQELSDHVSKLLQDNKLVGVVGGDHSSPFGAIQACAESVSNDYSIIHIDAHADLRASYQGFQHSHASIMKNVMSRDFAPKSLVQIGIRDFCPQERDEIESDSRIYTFFDRHIQKRAFAGQSWSDQCAEVLQQVPTDNVYLSVDIDGFSPEHCPHTGTPVIGGIHMNQFVELLSRLTQSSKKIIGFDLCEVAPESPKHLDGWDGNVGSRVLYHLCCFALASHD